jgi:hypothetical protein
MAAVTSVTIVARQVLGGVGRSCIADVVFSSTYATGGDTYTNAQFGMTTIQAIVPLGGANSGSTTSLVVVPDLANKKLRLEGGAASGALLAENSTADVHLFSVRVLVIGDFPYV